MDKSSFSIQMAADLASVSQRLISIDNHISEFKEKNNVFFDRLDLLRKEIYELRGYMDGRISDIRDEKEKDLRGLMGKVSYIMGGVTMAGVLLSWFINSKLGG